MSRLTYVRKFALATALFAIPLMLISVDSMLDHHQKSEGLSYRYAAVERLRELNELTTILNEIRDESVSFIFNPKLVNETTLQQHKQNSIKLLRAISRKQPFSESNLLRLSAENLRSAIEQIGVRAGSEGDSIYGIFNQFDELVDQSHKLTILLLTETGALTDEDPLTISIISMLTNDFSIPLENMGRARAFGAFFLEKGFIGSRDVLALSDISRKLEVSHITLQQKLAYLFQRYDSADSSPLIDIALLKGIPTLLDLLQDTIVLDPELGTASDVFWLKTNGEIAKLYQLRDQLMQFLLLRYQYRIELLQEQQTERSILIGTLIFIALYLFSGLFISVETSLNQLIYAARRVADGDLSTGVDIKTKDELAQLAHVFEGMRQQLMQRQDDLLKLTITDGLTGLYNRKHFNETLSLTLKHGLRSGFPVALLIIDIDYFKKINDVHGHQAGDECLIKMGKIMRSVLERETDTAFRFGGEEFALVLPHTDSNGGLVMAKKIWGSIRAATVMIGAEPLSFTASIGVACTDAVEGNDQLAGYHPELLIQAADNGLYKAKGSGRDCYIQLNVCALTEVKHHKASHGQ